MSSELYQRRAERLQSFIAMKAPAVIVVDAARLVIEAHCGGQWRAALWMLRTGPLAGIGYCFYVWRYRITGHDPLGVFRDGA